MVANLMRALLEKGHAVALLGAPGSPRAGPLHTVADAATPAAVASWLAAEAYDVVHDHSDGAIFSAEWSRGAFLSTHHLTGKPKTATNAVFLSEAQKAMAGQPAAPVVRLPVDVSRHVFRERKRDYLLFLGRVSPWKGALEAARFADAVGLRLYLAGPHWEEDYLAAILRRHGANTAVLGEVGGRDRLELLADARAVLVMSQPVPGPWGGIWSEPGASVVSEAAASGTPVVSSDNGCLPEITPHVGVVVPAGERLSSRQARDVLARLPAPAFVRAAAEREWGSHRIASQYEDLYARVMRGERWN
ncbi:MAG TPA: glycosyltransferase [Thermoanaerobaculia bacterium]|nr:glycosyltransferase [Thermoanaerobaculia bacterium]